MHHLVRNSVTLAMLSGGLGCATSGGRAGHPSCQLAQPDSVYLAGGPVYRDCAVDRRARLLSEDVMPDFHPTSEFSSRQCYSAVIQFVVDTTGVPESQTVRVVRSNDQSFADALIRTVPRLRYEPASKDQRPVRQIVQFGQAAALVAVPAGQVPRASRLPPC